MANTFLKRSLGTLAGSIADRLSPEPSNIYHPVAWLGLGLEQLETRTYADARIAGAGHTTIAIVASLVATRTVDRLLNALPGGADFIGTAMFVTVSSGGRMLGDTALQIKEHLDDDDLESARRLLPHLVGRDATTLSAEDITRAVIESVAENTVDAATAVATFGALSGTSGVWFHRTINTLDAMVGHRSTRYERFGWASAKLDDVVNWGPARLSVLATAAASMSLPGFEVAPGQIITTAFTDGKKHPSPNGGVIEAAFASALGITLGGTNTYGGRVEHRGTLGSGRAPIPNDIARCVALSNRVVLVLATSSVATAAILAGSRTLRRTRRR